jgi:hypothetical protein
MKVKLAVFVLAASLAAFGQGRGGHGMPSGVGPGMGGGMGSDRGPGMGGQMGRGQGQGQAGQHGSQAQTQQPLKDAQMNGGAFRMLEKKTGMTASQLEALYKSSGAKNFGQFVSAIVVSKNLGLNTQQVLDGLKTQSLGKTITSLGVDPKTAKSEIKKANQEIKNAQSGKGMTETGD